MFEIRSQIPQNVTRTTPPSSVTGTTPANTGEVQTNTTNTVTTRSTESPTLPSPETIETHLEQGFTKAAQTSSPADMQSRFDEVLPLLQGSFPNSALTSTSTQESTTPPDIQSAYPNPRGSDQSTESLFLRTRSQTHLELAGAKLQNQAFELSGPEAGAIQEILKASGQVADLETRSGQDAVQPLLHAAVVLDRTLRAGSPAYANLEPEQQQKVLSLLMSESLRDSVSPDIQGAGGAEASSGTTSGQEGHYVTGALNSTLTLLNRGELSPELIDQLDSLRTAPLSPELTGQRQALIDSTLQNIAFPESINQHSKGTCAATVPEMLLASQDPVNYVAIIQGLASPSGEASLPDGTRIQRESGTEQDDQSGRSVASRLLQPTLMETANQSKNYDNTTDRHSDGEQGLFQPETSYLLNALLGAGSFDRTLSLGNRPGMIQTDKATLIQSVEAAVQNGQPVPVSISWQASNHELLITGMDQDKVSFYNPHGYLGTMPRQEFEKRLGSASLPASDTRINLPTITGDPKAYVVTDPQKYMSQEDYNHKILTEGIEGRLTELEGKDPIMADQIRKAIASSSNPDALIIKLMPSLIQLRDAEGDTDIIDNARVDIQQALLNP